jgi:hypothetical protein
VTATGLTQAVVMLAGDGIRPDFALDRHDDQMQSSLERRPSRHTTCVYVESDIYSWQIGNLKSHCCGCTAK